MASPGPIQAALAIIENIELTDTPRDVEVLITKVIIDNKWANSKLEATAFSERWRGRVLSRLAEILSSNNKIGRPSTFCFNSSSEHFIQGACYIEPSDSDELKASKRRRSTYSNYLDSLNVLSPDQFEKLCGKIIGLLGVENPVVSRSSADEGIDFFGRLSFDSIFFPEDLSPTIQKQLNVWLVGQAKHYKRTQSGTPELRELVGSVQLARSKTYGSKQDPLGELTIRVADPVFLLFITTGTISSNGWTLLERSGVIGYDGQIVAGFLADREIGMTDGAFDENTFMNWLKQ